LAEVSPESPCGDDLEYDPVFAEMERAAQGKPEQQFGGTIVPAEEPNWKEVQTKALELTVRTKDLRVLMLLMRAALNIGRLPDFNSCVAAMRQLVEQRWEQTHPRLDPDDNLDPTQRVNLLASLCDSGTTLRYLKKVPLVVSKSLGRFNFRDLEIAKGDAPAPAADAPPPPTLVTIEAAFMDCDLEELKADARGVKEAIEHIGALESALTEKVGAGQSTSLEAAIAILKPMHVVLVEQLLRRGVVEKPAPGETAAAVNGEAQMDAPPAMDEIRSRDDVIRVLDKLCDYYAQYEPSSPLPLLLKRAKRLTSLSFMEIIQDLAPDAVAQAKTIGGTDSG
jgi:type VI secretion system protein ImpA